MSHRIALPKVPTNLFSGEPPSKRLALVLRVFFLRVFFCHRWAASFGGLTHYANQGTQSLFPDGALKLLLRWNLVNALMELLSHHQTSPTEFSADGRTLAQVRVGICNHGHTACSFGL